MAATAPLKKFPGAILIVSNGEFRYPITPLPSAQKDAESMRDFFGKTLNYQLVEMHVGLTANKFEICFKSFANKVKDPSLELAVVYLSSHGGRTSSPDQTFVCFKTTELSDPETPQFALMGDELIKLVGLLSCKRKILLLDCCHAGGIGSLKTSTGTATKPLEFEIGRTTGQAAEGLVVLGACKAEQEAFAGSQIGKASPFTKCIIKAFDAKDEMKNQGEYSIFLCAFLNQLSKNVAKNLGENSQLTIKTDNLVHFHEFIIGKRRKPVRKPPAPKSKKISPAPQRKRLSSGPAPGKATPSSKKHRGK